MRKAEKSKKKPNPEEKPKPGAKSKGLTAVQRRFVNEYMQDGNASAAAKRIGSHPDYGRQLVTNPHVKAEIERRTKKIEKKCDVSVEFVLTGLKENYARAMQLQEVIDREGNATGEFQYEGAVANRSLELMGKHLGMFTENIKLETPKPLIFIQDANGSGSEEE